MIGQTITFEYVAAPRIEPEGGEFDVLEQSGPDLSLKQSVKKTVRIVAVVDDRASNSFGLANLYLPFENFTEPFKIIEPNYAPETYGSSEFNVSINNYEDLDQVVSDLQDDGFVVFSAGQLLTQSVNVAFSVLQVFLAGFGFIALIASVFGIVSVMTISVLERKKEIGILKSLGARDGDIFKLFVLESTWIGVIGWLIGTGLALLSGLVINLVFTVVVSTNQEWRENLEALNITSFNPDFPWWLLLGTFLIALFFTGMAGVVPSYRAGKQNPVDVLRSE
jgi:ABC-type antimicrobial peptide transport system permease subunit